MSFVVLLCSIYFSFHVSWNEYSYIIIVILTLFNSVVVDDLNARVFSVYGGSKVRKSNCKEAVFGLKGKAFIS